MHVDLIDVKNLNKKNSGIKFLLTIICIFTEKHRNKKSDVVLKAFKTFINNIDKIPRSILMNARTEFVLVRKWCAESNIKTYLPYSSFRGSLIESFNQSIKNRIYRWMDSNIKLKIT